MDQHLSPQYGHVIMVSGKIVLTAVKLINIRSHSLTLARMCDMCGASSRY